MKLNNVLLGLMATTSTVLAFENIDFNLNHGGLYTYNNIDTTLPVYSNITKECQTELENSKLLDKCSFVSSMADLEENCEALYSDECTKFLSNMISYFPSCKNEKSIIDLSTSFKTSQVFNKYYCTLNGDGETCPNAKEYLTSHIVIYNNTLPDCAYKSCVENHIAMLQDSIENAELRNSLFIKNYKMKQSHDAEE